MALSVVGGGPNPDYVAELRKRLTALESESVGVVFIAEMRNGTRTLVALGEIDPDGMAGYAARCFASMANEAGEE